MRAYLDTNVLVAASVEGHQHHVQSFELVRSITEGVLRGCISTHGLAEFYSVVTRAPFSPRVHPTEAGRFLEDNILPHFDVVALSANDYKSVLRACASAGLTGGTIFDVLHLHSARKAGCDRIFTFNVKEFRSLADPDLAGKIAAP